MKRLPDAGFRSLPTAELIAYLVHPSVESTADREAKGKRLVAAASSMRNLAEISVDQLQKHLELGHSEAATIAAAIELGRRAAMAGRGEPTSINGPDDVFNLLGYLRYEKKEHFVAILLDTKMSVIRVATIHMGSLDMSVVGIREVFREAVRDGAAQIIVAHNHPSGDPEPSTEDIEITGKLKDAGLLLNIPLLDHVIIGEHETKSLKRLKLL